MTTSSKTQFYNLKVIKENHVFCDEITLSIVKSHFLLFYHILKVFERKNSKIKN